VASHLIILQLDDQTAVILTLLLATFYLPASTLFSGRENVVSEAPARPQRAVRTQRAPRCR
jgi:hypothetical protein